MSADEWAILGLIVTALGAVIVAWVSTHKPTDAMVQMSSALTALAGENVRLLQENIALRKEREVLERKLSELEARVDMNRDEIYKMREMMAALKLAPPASQPPASPPLV